MIFPLQENKHRILFLVAHRPGRSPGQRFRFEQYLHHLQQNGFDCQVSWLISEKDDPIFYANGKYLAKLLFLVRSLWKRFSDLRRVRQFDIVFLYREAHMLGTTFFERQIRRKGVKMVVDFDDSIWLRDVSNGNKKLAFLKRPSKTADIVAMCNAVIVGNQYLADYSLVFNPHVHIIPTTLDTETYLPVQRSEENRPVCIGWTGSSTTIKHFSLAVPVLQQIRQKYGEQVVFRVISDEFFDGHLEGLENIRWNKETELDDLASIDIGIMPLPDDAWARGKCGFKGLQYMALAKPAVMSPVGVNNEIIRHGENGFLAQDQKQWFDLLCQLIDDPQLRSRMGEKGRKTVVERFSFQSQKDRYLDIFKQLVAKS